MTAAAIDELALIRIRLPLVTPFRTSFGTWSERDILLVRVEAGGAVGWGECVAGTAPSYSNEYTAGAHHVIRHHLAPLVLDGRPLAAADVEHRLAKISGHRMAKAAIEAAVLDAELRRAGVSLAQHFGATRTRVPVGVSVGITDGIPAIVARVGEHLAEGYARIKIKIELGFDIEPCRALRAAHGTDFGLQVDANCAYRIADADHLARLDEFGLLLIEQPFEEEDLVSHRDLAARIETPVCLDETIVSERVAADAIALGAADVINVKPGRVGGHLAGRRLHDRCVDAGIPVWHGGMLETGIGRAANLALAALPGFTLPGDISASSRYWHRDVVTEPFTVAADGTMAVPSSPGIGVDVDVDFVSSVTHDVDRLHPSGASSSLQ